MRKVGREDDKVRKRTRKKRKIIWEGKEVKRKWTSLMKNRKLKKVNDAKLGGGGG